MTFTEAFPPSEWDFSKIPDDELRPCLIWEYGRESETFIVARIVSDLREKTQTSRWDVAAQKLVPISAKQRRDALQLLRESELDTFDLNGFLNSFWSSECAYDEWYDYVRQWGGYGSPPYQTFTPELRRHAAQSSTGRGIIWPIQSASIADLEHLWGKASVDLLEFRQSPDYTPEDEFDTSILYERVKPVCLPPLDGEDQRQLVAAFTIDLKRFSNKKIVRSFSDWLEKHRPKEWPEQTGRGKKVNDLRVALEALGVMRMLCHLKFRNPNFPQIYKKLGEAHCYKARKLAKRKFRTLFPFLPEAEEPVSFRGSRDRF